MMKNQAAPHARYIPALLDWSRLPAHERVLDGLADLIMNASDILDTLSQEDATCAPTLWQASYAARES